MTKHFCDWCKKEVEVEYLSTVDMKIVINNGESRVGMYAGGLDEICWECTKKLSSFILGIKEMANTPPASLSTK